MDAPVLEELNVRIGSARSRIEMWADAKPATEELARQGKADTGFAWFDIAVCHLLLGEETEARQAMDSSGRWMFEAVRLHRGQPFATYYSALEAAVMAGAADLMRTIAETRPEPEDRPSLIDDRAAWGHALPALVRGDDEEALIHAEEASRIEDTKAWYPGLGAAVIAVVSGDERSFNAGIVRVLEKHRRYAVAKRSWCHNWGPCLMCVPASVLVRLARAKGLAWDGPSHAKVPLTLMFTAPGTKVDIEVDFVPGIFSS